MYDTLSGEISMVKSFLIGVIVGLLYVFGFMVYEKIKENKHEKRT